MHKVELSFPQLFAAAANGSQSDADALFTALYSQLHNLARRELARQGSSITLGATTLLHQAYIEMAEKDGASFPDQARFMAYAARVMRGLIIDHARNRSAQKRGGEFHITSSGIEIADPADYQQLRRISDVLDELAKIEPELSEIVDMKFFCGFTFAEIAAMKCISERTAQRHWEKARIFLHHKLSTELEA